MYNLKNMGVELIDTPTMEINNKYWRVGTIITSLSDFIKNNTGNIYIMSENICITGLTTKEVNKIQNILTKNEFYEVREIRAFVIN